jgi:hypothetical protein
MPLDGAENEGRIASTSMLAILGGRLVVGRNGVFLGKGGCRMLRNGFLLHGRRDIVTWHGDLQGGMCP